jgi:hypothetical protein
MAKSIIEKQGSRICWLCNALYDDDSEKRDLHKHHIFMGKYRKIAEREGLWIHLCRYHHTGDIRGDAEAVHSPNKNRYSRMLQELAQKKWEETHSHEEWMDLMGENFIGREG